MKVKAGLDMDIYAGLIAKVSPMVIKSEEDYKRLLTEFTPLFERSMNDELSPEEDALFELLGSLIYEYEMENLVQIKSNPIGILKFFMEQQKKEPKDLWEVLGSKGLVSEILNGSRKININHAKKLAKIFNTSAALFLNLD